MTKIISVLAGIRKTSVVTIYKTIDSTLDNIKGVLAGIRPTSFVTIYTTIYNMYTIYTLIYNMKVFLLVLDQPALTQARTQRQQWVCDVHHHQQEPSYKSDKTKKCRKYLLLSFFWNSTKLTFCLFMFIMTNNFAFMQEHVGGENYRMNQGYFDFKDIHLNIIIMINRERHGFCIFC